MFRVRDGEGLFFITSRWRLWPFSRVKIRPHPKGDCKSAFVIALLCRREATSKDYFVRLYVYIYIRMNVYLIIQLGRRQKSGSLGGAHHKVDHSPPPPPHRYLWSNYYFLMGEKIAQTPLIWKNNKSFQFFPIIPQKLLSFCTESQLDSLSLATHRQGQKTNMKKFFMPL